MTAIVRELIHAPGFARSAAVAVGLAVLVLLTVLADIGYLHSVQALVATWTAP